MARHHPDEGERNGGHDDERHQIGAELGHHQQVDEDHPHPVGNAHVAEGLVGDLPLPVPQQCHLPQLVGLLHVILGQVDIGTGGKHAVERTVGMAAHVGHHHHHGLHVLVHDIPGGHLITAIHQLGDPHQLAALAAHLEGQYARQIPFVTGSQFDADRHRILGTMPLQPAGILIIHPAIEGVHQIPEIDPEQGRLAAIHHQPPLGLRVGQIDIHIHQICGGHKAGLYGARRRFTGSRRRAIHFRDYGRPDRRAGRHLNDFQVAPHRAGDGLQRLPNRLGNLVAAAMALMLVHQIDLNIPHVGTAANEVVAHQPVEVDGGGGAGVNLVILHLGHLGKLPPDRQQGALGLLQGHPLRHVEHQLEFRLVVEGEHLEHYPLHHGHGGGSRHQQQDGQPEFASGFLGTVTDQEGGHQPLEETGFGLAVGTVHLTLE